MKSSIHMALAALLASALLLSATGANAACAYQSIAYGQTVNASLSTTDCTDDINGSLYYADYYLFAGTAGDKIYIQQSSTSIDPWLMLIFPSGSYLTDNNGGGGTTARIPATSGYYTLPESGTYVLEASSNISNTTGNYTLSLAKDTAVLPGVPTNVTATAGNGSATVSFTPGSIGSGTLVKYWAACGVDTTHLITASGSSSPITVTGLTNGTVYYCWAITESTVGYSSSWSAVSNTVTPAAPAAPASAQTGKNYSDSWWNASESGWGITITDHDTDAFVQWYTYDQTGHNQKYVFSGTFSSDKCQLSGNISQVSGPSWTLPAFDPNQVVRRTTGTGTFNFCPTGLASGTIVFNYTNVDGVTGSKQLTRLPFGDDVPRRGCMANTGAADFTDLWWNPNESGWGVSVTQHGNNLFFRVFVYDTDGKPLLFIVSGVTNSPTSFTGNVTLTTGPWFGNATFNPNQVVRTTTPGNTATLTFSDANNGTLTYTINGVTKTKSITRMVFGNTVPAVCGDASDGVLSGSSSDQAKFIAARGYPHLFTLNFVTGVMSGGKPVQLNPPRRIETWVYNDANVTSALFDNGFFIKQETLGAHTSLKSTNLKPEMFTLGMTEAQVIAVAGQPTCVDTIQMAGMSMRFLRYAATADSPVAAIGMIDGELASVSAGFLLGDRTDPGTNLCSSSPL